MNIFDKLQMEESIKEMWGILDEQIQLYKLNSRLMKEYYNALTAEGFTNEQALELVKAHGISGGIISSGNNGGK